MNERSQPEQPRNDTAPDGVRQSLPRIESTVLLKGTQEIIIDHLGQEYHLRLTNQGKLLLTK